MRMVMYEPKAILIADPCDTGKLLNYLEEERILWRPDPKVSWTENLMEFAGRLCYDSFEREDGFQNLNLTKVREGNKEYLGNVIKQGHGSVFEHGGPLVILFSNVSRVFTHELVRHRVGTAFSQTSGRYVRLDKIPFWVPPSITGDARDIMEETITFLEGQQAKLAECFTPDMPFSEKKALTSAFRRVGPTGVLNNILMSCNHRAMRHIFEMRLSDGAEEEMRFVLGPLGAEMLERFPSIYQDFDGKSFGFKKI